MRAALVIFGLIACTPALADDALPRGGELGEMHYACFGDDADAFTGSKQATAESCKFWEELETKAKAAGLCYDAEALDWKPCN